MNNRAFTLVELLTVMAIIAILAGLILMTSGFVQKKSASSRAEAEVQAFSAALESYKADNAIYPRDAPSDVLDARKHFDPTAKDKAIYESASLFLYKELSGDRDPLDRSTDTGGKSYMQFKPNMLSPRGGKTVTALIDPFGNSYGYSTAYAKSQELPAAAGAQEGFNPTFDLWSTATGKTASDQVKWIKNW